MRYLLNIETEERISLWRSFKSKCSLNGENMIDVIFILIKEYVK